MGEWKYGGIFIIHGFIISQQNFLKIDYFFIVCSYYFIIYYVVSVMNPSFNIAVYLKQYHVAIHLIHREFVSSAHNP